MRGLLLLAAVAVPCLLPAQVVRGRVLESEGGPIVRALVELRRPDGSVASRGVTAPSGAFALGAAGPGNYQLRVAAIGFTPRLTRPFEVPAAGIEYGDLRLERVAVTLADLEVLGTSRCGGRDGGSALMSRLLDAARTSLDVMAATIAAGGSGFGAELVQRTAIATRGDSLISADTTSAALLRWPIESVPPDSLQRLGFMVPSGFGGPEEGHLWFGPDARVLLADWFLEGHCFRVERRAADSAAITVVFEPVPARGRVDIAGTMVFDPGTLALRRLTFEHRNVPAPLRAGMAGGELRFAQLPSGTWLPVRWRLFAPITSVEDGRAEGSTELSGRVVVTGGGETPPGRSTDDS